MMDGVGKWLGHCREEVLHLRDDSATQSRHVDSDSQSPADGPSGRRTVLMLGIGACVVFAFFLVVGGSNHLFRGHDHWLSGQAMMLAKGYESNDFHTPDFMMMENPTGAEVNWAPYTGWPPLFFAVLAVLIRIFGESLLQARILAAFSMACTAALCAHIALQITKKWEAVWLTFLIFCANRIITSYCTLVFCDVPAVTLCLLLLALFPAYLRTRTLLGILGYLVLVLVGTLLSWQCYMVPPVCAVLTWFHLRRGGRMPWTRACVPLGVCAMVGLLLLVVGGHVESNHVPNCWFPPEANHLFGKFMQRSILGEPTRAFWHIGCFVYLVGVFSSTVLLLVSAGHALRRSLPSSVTDMRGQEECDRRLGEPMARFYFNGLWLFPLLWLLFMPEMHQHDFQVIFWVPFITVALVASIIRLVAGLPSARARSLWYVFTAVSLVWIVLWHVPKKVTEDSGKFSSMEKEVRNLTASDAIVVTTVNDRGVWWRIRRPVIGWNRIDEVRMRNHVLLVDFDVKKDSSWKHRYEILLTVTSSQSPYNGYTLLRSKGHPPGTSPANGLPLRLPASETP